MRCFYDEEIPAGLAAKNSPRRFMNLFQLPKMRIKQGFFCRFRLQILHGIPVAKPSPGNMKTI